MFRNRAFNIFIGIALVILLALTVREAFATSSIISSANTTTLSYCESLPSRLSIHTERAVETGSLFPYTEDGPTGVDGGLIQLLSDYRTCSR